MAGARRVHYDRAMSVRAAFVIGFLLVVAAFLHGGIYSAGHDFVMNRFTGAYEFVPADDYDERDEARHVGTDAARALTSMRAAARVQGLQCRR